MTTSAALDTSIATARRAWRPGLGTAFIVFGALSLGLLIAHPADSAGDFAGLLRSEAANAIPNAIVHGGYIAVLAAEMIAFAVLGVRLGAQRTPVVAALVLTAAAAGALSLSMTIDGLVVPAVAAKYAAAPAAALPGARALFVVCGLLVRFLMPIGVAFLSAGAIAWSLALAARDRIAAILGLLIGAASLAGLALTVSTLNPMVAVGALGGQAIWLLALGVGQARGPQPG